MELDKIQELSSLLRKKRRSLRRLYNTKKNTESEEDVRLTLLCIEFLDALVKLELDKNHYQNTKFP